jgi:hypothetical protein
LAGTQGQLAGIQGGLYGTAGDLENAGFNNDLTRRNQWIGETRDLRDSAMNDYKSMFGLSQGVTPPNLINTPQGQIPATDVTTPQLAALQASQAAKAAGSAQSQGTMGGLFGLGGSALMAGALAFSDERLKENIAPIGETYDGQNLYAYNYKGDSTPQVGLMAQEVEKRDPGAVVTINGYKAVDYGRALKRSMFGLQ